MWAMSRQGALGAVGPFLVGMQFFGRQWKVLVTLLTLPDFEIGHAFFINFRWQQQFARIVPKLNAVGKLDHGKAHVKDLKGRLLALPVRDMPHDKDRLPSSLRLQFPQGALGGCRDGEASGRTGSCCRHEVRLAQDAFT